MGSFLGGVSGLIVLATGVVWFRRMLAVRIPADRTAFVSAMLAAVTIAIIALAGGLHGVAKASAIFALVGGGTFLFLVALSAQDKKTPAVSVGGAIIDFSAPDENGDVFDLSAMAGSPFLLKFFRGHW